MHLAGLPSACMALSMSFTLRCRMELSLIAPLSPSPSSLAPPGSQWPSASRARPDPDPRAPPCVPGAPGRPAATSPHRSRLAQPAAPTSAPLAPAPPVRTNAMVRNQPCLSGCQRDWPCLGVGRGVAANPGWPLDTCLLALARGPCHPLFSPRTCQPPILCVQSPFARPVLARRRRRRRQLATPALWGTTARAALWPCPSRPARSAPAATRPPSLEPRPRRSASVRVAAFLARDTRPDPGPQARCPGLCHRPLPSLPMLRRSADLPLLPVPTLSVLVCKAGFAGSTCTACPLGSTSVAGTLSTPWPTCTSCPAGFTNAAAGSATCQREYQQPSRGVHCTLLGCLQPAWH